MTMKFWLLFDITHWLILEPCTRDSECFPRLNGHFLHGWDPLYYMTIDQAGESKSTRLLRFSSMSGKDVRASRSKCKIERSTSRLPTVQRLQRIIWNRWRTCRVRVEYFPRIHTIADSPQDSRETGRLSNKSRKFWRSNHLHVDVVQTLWNPFWNCTGCKTRKRMPILADGNGARVSNSSG